MVLAARRPTFAHGRLDAIRSLFRFLVFPHTDHCPSRIEQRSVGSSIASLIGVNFLSPPRRVRLRPGCVLWAPMPEAPVNKDRNPCPREYQIGSPSPIRGKRRTVDE